MKGRLTRGLAVATGLTMTSAATIAAADPTVEDCARADEAAGILRDSGKLSSARERSVLCSSSSCPQATRDKCSARVSAIDAAMPTLVFVVTDSSREDLAAVRVSMDGHPLLERVDGPAVAVDLGEHTLRFEADGFVPVTRTIVARETEKSRRIEVTLERSGAPLASAPLSSVSSSSSGLPAAVTGPGAEARTGLHSYLPSYVAWGVGAIGLTVGITTGALAIGTKASLDSVCAAQNACPPSSQRDIARLNFEATLSNVGFGVTIIGAAAGAVLFWLAHKNHAAAVMPAWLAPGMFALQGRIP